MAKLDINRALRGLQLIRVEGLCNTGIRHKAIEDAIAAIQRDGAAALEKEYIGVKNYAAFGDQREDHRYGYGPKHGDIVFRIERQPKARETLLTDDAVYLLEAERDFKGFPCHDGRPWNLCRLLASLVEHQTRLASFREALDNAEVTEHAVEEIA